MERPSLGEEQAVEQPFDIYFLCGICKFVVNFPQECNKCQKIACKECMNTWAKHKNTCAHCKQQFKTTPPHKFVMGTLNDKHFLCTKCKSQFRYERYEAHALECFVSYRCPYKCKTITLFKTLNDLENHLRVECEKMTLTCSECPIKELRSNLRRHKCFKKELFETKWLCPSCKIVCEL